MSQRKVAADRAGGASPARPPLTAPRVCAVLATTHIPQAHPDPGRLVLRSLGLWHGKRRVDLAVIADRIHIYQVKVSRPALATLLAQVDHLGRLLSRVTLVHAASCAQPVSRLVPPWWGLIVADRAEDGTPELIQVRAATPNPEPDPVWLAELLWVRELDGVCHEAGLNPRRIHGDIRMALARTTPFATLERIVCSRMKARPWGWLPIYRPSKTPARQRPAPDRLGPGDSTTPSGPGPR